MEMLDWSNPVRGWILLDGRLQRVAFGEIELLDHGVKIMPPGSWLKRFGMAFVMLSLRKITFITFLSLLTKTCVELLIPYRRVLNVELVKEWAGWWELFKDPHVRLYFVDEFGNHKSVTFAAVSIRGVWHSPVSRGKTVALYEELKRRTQFT